MPSKKVATPKKKPAAPKKKPATRANTTPPPAGPGRDERIEITITKPTPPDAPRYHPGFRVRLTRAEIETLGLPADTYAVSA